MRQQDREMKKKVFQIRAAGHCIEIVPRYPQIYRLCKDYLCTGDEPEYSVRVTQDEIRREQTAYGPVCPDGYLETLAVYRKLAVWMMEHDTVLLHGSAVAVNGQAYLFTAPSGTGKSTHTRLWREYFGEKAVMINDDKPLLQIGKQQATVFGTPWNGKHGLGNNISAPLKGICVLRQGKQNQIRRMEKSESFPVLLNQIYRPYENPDRMAQLLCLMDRLLEIPVWEMKCTISHEAVSLAYETMK